MVETGLKEVKTGVDKLVDFLRGRGMVDMQDAAEEIGYSPEAIQTWVDFLVEEEIVGVDYKFTKPYIYLLNKKPMKMNKDLSNYRKKFEDAAKKKEVPENKTEFLWKNHMLSEVEKKKDFFIAQANLRNLDNVEALWAEYRKRIGA